MEAFDERHSYHQRLTSTVESLEPLVTDLESVPDNTHDALTRCLADIGELKNTLAGWKDAGTAVVEPVP